MKPEDIKALHEHVIRIERLDFILDALASGCGDRLEELGDQVMKVLGRNVLDGKRGQIGAVTVAAIFNGILEEREDLRLANADVLDIPPSEYTAKSARHWLAT